MFRKLLTILAAFAGFAAPAGATWFEASTPHFIIDADSTEPKVRDFAARLERFDAALRKLYNRPDDPSRRSNRVRVYAVPATTIRTFCRDLGCPRETAGFYDARAGGSVIFTSALAGSGDLKSVKNLDLDPQEVLFHEYSHHFLYSAYPNAAFPLWFSEGFAEFNANMIFAENGGSYVGTAANYRAFGLQLGPTLKVATLLAPSPRDLADEMRHEAIYGRSWLLMHYMMLSNERKAQVNDYLQRIMKGEESVAAGRAAFGDLAALDQALKRYMEGKLNLPAFVAATPLPEITVRPLSPGAAAMMPIHMRSTARGDKKAAARLVPAAEAAAAPYRDDPRVQTQLAEAEFDAGRLDQADLACDRALAADPQNMTALLYKAKTAMRRLKEAKSQNATEWQAARRLIARASRADTEAAGPLVAYYMSYRMEGATPPKIAVDGLKKAAILAGEDDEVRWLLARQSVEDGDKELARMLLMPIALSPHDKGAAARARGVVALLDADKMAEAKGAFESAAEGAGPTA